MDMYQLAQALFGKGDDKSQSGATTTMYGTATSNSVDGRVDVVPDGAIIGGSGNKAEVNMATVVAVNNGDRVIITVVDGTPTVTGVVGYGDATAAAYQQMLADLSDRMDTAKEDAEKLAQEAREVAEAIGQHFWADDNGVHVSDEDKKANGAHNILLNSLGFLLRLGDNNLAALTKSAITFYDGEGNTDSHIRAHFGGDNATIGSYTGWHSKVDATGFTIYNGQEGAKGLNNIIASFGRKTVALGNGYSDAVIYFCNALGYITQKTIYGLACLTMYSEGVALEAGEAAGMYVGNSRVQVGPDGGIVVDGEGIVTVQSQRGSSLILSQGIQGTSDGYHLRLVPVHKLYNQHNGGDHMWTEAGDDVVRDLVSRGWTDEGTIYVFAATY